MVRFPVIVLLVAVAAPLPEIEQFGKPAVVPGGAEYVSDS
jgi:hypothetical protein